MFAFRSRLVAVAAQSTCRRTPSRISSLSSPFSTSSSSSRRSYQWFRNGEAKASRVLGGACAGGAVLGVGALFHREPKCVSQAEMPAHVIREQEKNAALPVDTVPRTSYAPDVPLPVNRKHPARVVVHIESRGEIIQVGQTEKYTAWTFDGHIPGPFVRAHVGDLLEVHHTNNDSDGIAHNIDFHAVTGPGGGAPALLAEQGETKVGYFKLTKPGLYIYHCAAAPVPMHIANGMYGLLLVEPEGGLPPVDKEFYVLQSEFYGQPSLDDDDREKRILEPSYEDGMMEHPRYVVFNGREGALVDKPLLVQAGDKVRIFFGNAGPNLVSSFHIIGTIFDQVHREGDVVSPPAQCVQTTLVPAGGATIVTMDVTVPGNYTLVDHSIFRIDKGAIGFLKVAGEPRPDLYDSKAMLNPCPGCKLHN